ncbi:glycoside hydrolase family 43 protein [Arachidicoccus ginsenosidivorans]|uniref:Family 43 glycosylhydrolase n=1 Tax=Arachidicoccus ginsenosidivorans TaxID=496057 RepID=A0A5B8VH22_9BACT|nr:glycoside hydrolase family 43 protein [Arachidicoccus ginsenosidivorans]QEC70814.1 family 43 glycosylhydrolase [Arachidicoccus ginsenosidivorans]
MQQIHSFYRFLTTAKTGSKAGSFSHLTRPQSRVILFSLCLVLLCGTGCQRSAFLYTSFHEPASQGLRLLYSMDGYHWDSLPGIFLRPEAGSDKIMRDPSMVQGPDGVFHLVWTLAWKGNKGFGYASSKDLIHWSKQKVVDVMRDQKGTVNVWAPELFYRKDKNDFLIVWASTIPFKFPKGIEDEDNNHRLYYTITKDFEHFSSPKLYYDPGFSSIDATLVQLGKSDFVLVFKDNTRHERDIKVSFGSSALGPFTTSSAAVTPAFSEGPSTLKIHGKCLIYYDWYRKGRFGAVSTKDFKHFENITNKIYIPQGHKHGTIVPVSRKFLKSLQVATKSKRD